METTPPSHPAATEELVERVAAAFHTLIRSWHYDLDLHAGDGPRRGPVPLDHWIEPVRDPAWIARGRPTVDIANTWWGDLPADWRQQFREVAAVAAGEVVRAVEEGRSAIELLDDEPFVERVGRLLARPWLSPPRVIFGGEAHGPGLAGEELALAAIHVYGAQLERPRDALLIGDVPRIPARDASSAAQPAPVASLDEKHATFVVIGDHLDPDLFSGLLSTVPERSHRRHDLNISWRTGAIYRTFTSGHWSITSREHVDPRTGTLDEHVRWLLGLLEPRAPELRAVAAELGLRSTVRGIVAQRGWQASWELDNATLRRISALGTSLSYDSYANDHTSPFA